MANTYFGKYRAKVLDTDDPEKRGRVKVSCPSVLGESSSGWCELCVPVAFHTGGDFTPWQPGNCVWVEFEQGDPNLPIVVGSWWGKDELPTDNNVGVRIIEFYHNYILMTSQGISINANDGTTIVINNQGLHVNGVTVSLVGHTH